MKAIATLLIYATLAACGGGDHAHGGAVSPVADIAIAAAPLPAAEPAPVPVATPTPTPVVVTAPTPAPVPPAPPIVVVEEPVHEPDYSDCRCNSAGVLICTEPNPPYYIFCPSPPRANPAPCIYECNNESGPVTY